MKYVYVLVSSPNDLYYEQALMSVYSLRRHMKDADVVFLVDDTTAASFFGKPFQHKYKTAEGQPH